MVEKVFRNDRLTSATDSNTSDSTDRTMELHYVCDKLEQFQDNIVKDIEKRISSIRDEIMQQIRQRDLQINEFKHFAQSPIERRQHSTTWSNRTLKESDRHVTDSTLDRNVVDSAQSKRDCSTKNTTKRMLPDKIFVTRESYLTALLEVDHMKAIYHIFYIILFVFFMNSICHDYFVEGRVNFGLGTFKSGLNKIHYVLAIWLVDHVFIFGLYYAFKCWAYIRDKLHKQDNLLRLWSICCLVVYVSFQLLFGYIASAACLKLDLPFVTASVLLLESTRLLMKMHAYVRTNAARVVTGKLKSEQKTQSLSNLPPFSCYLYFLFAPTLLYRDSYPRTTQIRWKFAISRLMEVVATAFLYSYIHERHIKANFHDYGIEELNFSTLIPKLFGMIMPSIVMFLSGFYLILHSWLNFTAELLRFGDRMFYKNWWTSSSLEAYYRDWNIVVHDWLYEYIYKDFINYVFKGSKTAASLTVFLISAIVHEHIISFALQYFFPVMFVCFAVISVPLIFLTRQAFHKAKNFGNLFLWGSLIIGNSIVFSLYSMEVYARRNCARTNNSWVDLLIPSVWSCYRS
ncbi:sterol O-acyltransferase 1-like [Teleopsis dalmanni]|uniref:sterol O-acyltransferase 1-like n=1 Tax=Teleopsis dalmanni TaxID=139649 RepID=UPI0018CF74C6|nr:sterol O-acyltransferase 1-like [Teleopsis dalmanni]